MRRTALIETKIAGKTIAKGDRMVT